jgi:hypothetical protein
MLNAIMLSVVLLNLILLSVTGSIFLIVTEDDETRHHTQHNGTHFNDVHHNDTSHIETSIATLSTIKFLITNA